MKIIEITVDKLPECCFECNNHINFLSSVHYTASHCSLFHKKINDPTIRPEWCKLKEEKK